MYCLELLVFYTKKENNWSCILYKFGAKYTPAIKQNNQYIRLFAPMILHASIMHLFSNSLSILFICFFVEGLIQNKIILLYFLSGVFGNDFSMIFSPSTLAVGASTCMMGVCATLLVYYATRIGRMDTNNLFDFVLFAALTFANAFNTSGNIDFFGHVGGFLFGIVASPHFLCNKGLNEVFNELNIKRLKILSLAIIVGYFITSKCILLFSNIGQNMPAKLC